MINDYHLQIEASQFRLTHGIGASEPIRLKSWLPKLGVVALFKPLSDNFSGMAVKQGDQKFIIVNSEHRLSKQHFTVAHELYHLFIQKDFIAEVSHAGRFDKKDKTEYAADWFAAYLLMPEDGILSLIPKEELSKNKISLSTLIKIEQYFACSRTALLIRLERLGLIDYRKYEAYTKNVIASAVMLGYDDTLYKKGNANLVIGDYGSRAKNLFDKGVISESHFISLMNDIGVDIPRITNDNEQE
ncbi:ImmA/IrrE family metallo-endopeptidase [Solitalea sp. MAHUQ-68]|uniref:ImmA/IrrE family metallo-endopeptidase n=1 Tax=Solitalea agri TaxID=2953739 RepID=A0A9X2JAW5_9SPHI|nr:ImmA/IrrE family metallo-endopeptidase [Solitalea agri]MCO4291353.1 ImmA/IrrE family metallo-endopeptidase [Solitalea agri]